MKRTLLLALSAAALLISACFAAMPYAPENVIAIHIGAKNPTFDESQFPDIKFYYTPNLKWTAEKTTGKPELLADWINKKGLRMDEAIVLDKKGNVAFKNILISFKKIVDANGQGDLDTMGNVLKNVVEENKPAPYVSSKPFDPSDISLLGQKLPDLMLQDSSGKPVSLAGLIGSSDKPKLLFFYRIPSAHVFRDISKSMKDVTSPLQMLGAVSEQSVGDEYLAILKRFEDDLYCR